MTPATWQHSSTWRGSIRGAKRVSQYYTRSLAARQARAIKVFDPQDLPYLIGRITAKTEGLLCSNTGSLRYTGSSIGHVAGRETCCTDGRNVKTIVTPCNPVFV